MCGIAVIAERGVLVSTLSDKMRQDRARCAAFGLQSSSTIWLTVAKNKLGLGGGEQVEIIDLRIEPDKSKEVVDNKKYFAGYHMNKKSWLTICLDGSVPTETILAFIDRSYQLALKK